MRYEFTYNQEIGHQGQSLVPHFPGGKSGVTIGPGYDMGGRSSEQIYNDLTRVGIDPEVAETLSQAAYKTGNEANRWIQSHGGLNITEEQQKALFEEVLVPDYEARMATQLQHFAENYDGVSSDMIDIAQLSERQKHILFDYTYNAGLSKFPTLVEAVLTEDWDKVSLHFERFSAGEPLYYRNELFYQTFLDAESVAQFEKSVEIDAETLAIEGLLDDIANNDDQQDDNDNLDLLLDDSQW